MISGMSNPGYKREVSELDSWPEDDRGRRNGGEADPKAVKIDVEGRVSNTT